MLHTEQQWIGKFNECGALWVHDGNPLRPHAILTSGKHSGHFFNAERVKELPRIMDKAANDLVERLQQEGFDISTISRVIAPAMGAITTGHDIARIVSWNAGTECYFSVAEKKYTADGELYMQFTRSVPLPGERTLCAEDVITSGGSAALMGKAAVGHGAEVIPYVLCLCNRSGKDHAYGMIIIGLIAMEMPSYVPHECPYCQMGSVPLKPKELNNWALLNAAY